MEGSMSYRSVRKIKSRKIKSTSQTLLTDFRHKIGKSKLGIMGKNVSEFEHMIKIGKCKQNYITWATNLRQSIEIEEKQKGESTPPQVFFKDTQSNTFRKKEKENLKLLKFSEFPQFSGRKKINRNSLDFVNTLRSSENLKDKNTFTSHHKKNYTQFTQFLAKNALHKVRDLQKKDYETCFEGSNKFPFCTSSKFRQKNSSLLKQLTTPSRINVNSLVWHVGLRNY